MADDDLKVGGWMLSRLLQAPEDALQELQKKYLAESTNANVNQLTIARRWLQVVHRALITGDEKLWEQLDEACEPFQQGSGAASAGRRESTADSAPVVVGAAAVAAAAAVGSAAAPPKQRSKLEPMAEFASTAPLKPSYQSSNPLPFRSDAPGPATEDDTTVTHGGATLSLSQYAELTVTRTQSPERWRQARLQYGISTDVTFAALENLWNRRFREEPELHRRWTAACERGAKGR